MPRLQVQRRLVKSPPELWAEVSDPAALAKHLGEFGEIRITRSDAESTVAWEGNDDTSGTVEIAGSGWGTRVTLTLEVPEPEPAPAPPPEPTPPVPEPAPEPPAPEPAPEPTPQPEAEPRRGFFARLFGRKPTPVTQETPEPERAPDFSTQDTEIFEAVEPDPEPLAAEPEPAPAEPAPAPAPAPEPEFDTEHALAVLETVLDDLGAAHHRPFSRAE